MWWMLAAAAVGAAAGAIGTYQQGKKQKDSLEHQRDSAWQQYLLGKGYSDSMYRLQKGEALDTLGIQKNRLAQAFDMDLAGFNLGLEGQALGSHAARVGLSESEGAALAAQGASGTRGSDSLQMQIDYQENMFGRQMDLQDRGNSLAVQNMATQYGNARGDIDREMASWGPDGYKTRAKNLSDTYNRDLANLGRSDFDWQIAFSQPDILDYTVGMFGGASSGAGMGASIDSYRDAWNNIGGGNGSQAMAYQYSSGSAYQQSQVMANQQTARYYGRLPY